MYAVITRTCPKLSACARGFGFAVAVLAATVTPALAAPPLDAGERKAVIGVPASVEVVPAAVTLSGVRDARQLVVSAKYADGTVRDLTGVVEAKVEPQPRIERGRADAEAVALDLVLAARLTLRAPDDGG